MEALRPGQLRRHQLNARATWLLRYVATLAGVSKNTTRHTARHSFADWGRLGSAAADLRDLLNPHSIIQTGSSAAGN